MNHNIQAGQTWVAKNASISWNERILIILKVDGKLVKAILQNTGEPIITDVLTVSQNYQLTRCEV